MALAAVSFKVVILLLFIHCMMLLLFDGFVVVTCFVVQGFTGRNILRLIRINH